MGKFKLFRSGLGFPLGPYGSLANLKTYRHKPVFLRVYVCNPARTEPVLCIIFSVPRTIFSSSPISIYGRKWEFGDVV